MLDNIHSGRWRPGGRIPTRDELRRRYGAYSVTMQDALRSLARAGFVEARGRAGTFVVERSPHLTRVAIVFPAPRHEVARSRFWASLLVAADVANQQNPGTFRTFFDIESHHAGEDYEELCRLVETRSLLGIVFAANPFDLVGTPILDAGTIPRVAIMSEPAPTFPRIVYNDVEGFFKRAVERLAHAGRRRLGAIVPNGQEERMARWLAALSSRFGIQFKPHWMQCADFKSTLAARNATMLLLSPANDERPDALIVADDHLVPNVTEGMYSIGVRAPATGLKPRANEVDTIAMCHFTNPPENPLGFTLLGFDSEALLDACVARLDELRRDRPGPASTLVAPRFAEEFRAVPSSVGVS